jgi:hypothetical protein
VEAARSAKHISQVVVHFDIRSTGMIFDHRTVEVPDRSFRFLELQGEGRVFERDRDGSAFPNVVDEGGSETVDGYSALATNNKSKISDADNIRQRGLLSANCWRAANDQRWATKP